MLPNRADQLTDCGVACATLDPLRLIQKIFEGGRQRRTINPKRNDRVAFRDRSLDLPTHMRGRDRRRRQDENQD